MLPVTACGGCVNQRLEVDRYRRILDEGAGGHTDSLERGEELTLVRALRLANQDNGT